MNLTLQKKISLSTATFKKNKKNIENKGMHKREDPEVQRKVLCDFSLQFPLYYFFVRFQ